MQIEKQSYYQRNREKILRQVKEWQRANPDKVRKSRSDANREKSKLRKDIREASKASRDNKKIETIKRRSVIVSKKEGDVFYRHKNGRLLRQYGISLDEYNKILLEQNNACKICNKPETKMHKNIVTDLAVDHDHVTGKVRGLLCFNCNLGLGKFQDDPIILEKAIKYLSQ